MMTLTDIPMASPVDQRLLGFCCCFGATTLAIASGVTRVGRRTEHIEFGPWKNNSCSVRNQSLKFRPLRIQCHQLNRGGVISHPSKTSSSLDICAAAFAICAQMQTEPLTRRQQQTATRILSPYTDDGGNKLPPGDGGGDGGCIFKFYRGGDGDGLPPRGGGDWSGEFFFILFLVFLALLRDRNKEKMIQEEEEEQEDIGRAENVD